MKTAILTILILIPLSAFCEGLFKKTDPKVMKQIQYRKVMAIEQSRILDKYIQCLNMSHDTASMNKCTAEKNRDMKALSKDARDIKAEVGEKTGS